MTFGLNGVQFWDDGDRIGGGRPALNNMFEADAGGQNDPANYDAFGGGQQQSGDHDAFGQSQQQTGGFQQPPNDFGYQQEYQGPPDGDIPF